MNFLNLILGWRMCKTSSSETVSKYTRSYKGCSLVNLDEIPIDQGSFRSIRDALKNLVTEPTFACRDMYSLGYTQRNTFNVIVTSNNDASNLTRPNEERYIVLDISQEKKDAVKYFGKLSKPSRRRRCRSCFTVTWWSSSRASVTGRGHGAHHHQGQRADDHRGPARLHQVGEGPLCAPQLRYRLQDQGAVCVLLQTVQGQDLEAEAR